ncbi:MAG: hypothetical protein JW893_03530 [Candidatus Omnitrophica bacterium]|nr:hypothetical protein [Candidatus Omnitrophota bacterium]
MNHSVPFFHATFQNGKTITRGISHCNLGHKIPIGTDRIDGIYVDWNWDGQRLEVKNDLYGFYPLYVYHDQNEICISPSIVKLLAEGAKRDLNWPALGVFMRAGFFIKDDTPFRYIRALPPNAKFLWGNGKLKISGSYTLRDENKLTLSQALDDYIDLFRQAIKRRLPRNRECFLPLSGGRDSRHILFELLKNGIRPQSCITVEHYTQGSNEDARIAQLLASTFSLKHILLRQTVPFFNSEYRKNFLTNMCTDEHTHFLIMADILANSNHAIYDGIGGDILTSSRTLSNTILQLFRSRNFRELSNLIFRCDENLLKWLLRRNIYSKMNRESAIEYLTTELEQHTDVPNPPGSFYFWNRTRREISLSSYALCGFNSLIHMPYIDYDLFNFLAGIPTSLLLNQDFHTRAISRAFPEFDNIPYQDKTVKDVDRESLQDRFFYDVLAYLMRYPFYKTEMLQLESLIPRCLHALISPSKRRDSIWFTKPLLYLLQLEELATKPAVISNALRIVERRDTVKTT